MCPLCKEALNSVAGLSQAFSWATLLMLVVPFLVVSVISFIIVRAYRNSPNPQHKKYRKRAYK